MSSKLLTLDEYNAYHDDGSEPATEVDKPCWICGEVEGIDGRLPWVEPANGDDPAHLCYAEQDADEVYLYWCPPMPANKAECSACYRRRWHHELTTSESSITGDDGPVCRECIRRDDQRRSNLKRGAYKLMDCACDDCFDSLWVKAGGRPSGKPRGRSRSKAKRSGASSSSHTRNVAQERAEALREDIATKLRERSWRSADLASELGVDKRTIERHIKALGAVAHRDGKSVSYSLD